MKDKNVGSVLKTESKVIAYVVICLVIIVLGISYALFFDVKGNEKNQIVKAGTLEFSYANGSEITNTSNGDCFIPMNNEEALKHSECEYKIGITNTGTLPGNYNINITSDTSNQIELSKLKILLKKEGELVEGYPKAGTETSLVTNEKIEAGGVVNYTIQVYVDVDNELLNADDDEKNISLKINGDAVVSGEDINPAAPVLASDYIKTLATVESGDGLYAVPHNDLTELGTEWSKTEYRYAGVNPNNYVRFNNEIWRIIGLVNVKVGSSVEQRVKIVRTDGVGEQKNFGNYYWDRPISESYTNNWTTSKLKDMLNGIYYESSTGDCYKSDEASQCDFNTGTELPKGLDDTARNMIDKEATWNIGGISTLDLDNVTVRMFYEKERGISTYSKNGIVYPSEWSKETDVGDKYNGIGLIYPSDYGYATNGGNLGRETCFAEYLIKLDNEDENYKSECGGTDWLKLSSGYLWTLSPYSSYSDSVVIVLSSGYVDLGDVGGAYRVEPVGYLKSSVKIAENPSPEQEYGTIDNPFILK